MEVDHLDIFQKVKDLCRTDYLKQTLASLSELSGLDLVTVYVSQDGSDPAVRDVVQHFGQNLLAFPNTRGFEHWQRERVAQLGPDQARPSALCRLLTCCLQEKRA